MSMIARRIARLEESERERMHLGEWCEVCGHGQRLVILQEDEPEPICDACGTPTARGTEARVIRIVTREDGPR